MFVEKHTAPSHSLISLLGTYPTRTALSLLHSHSLSHSHRTSTYTALTSIPLYSHTLHYSKSISPTLLLHYSTLVSIPPTPHRNHSTAYPSHTAPLFYSSYTTPSHTALPSHRSFYLHSIKYEEIAS